MTIEPQPSTKRPRADAIRNLGIILETSKALIAEKGSAFSFEEIARRSNLGIGTIYRHFPTKLDLSAALYSDQLSELLLKLRLVGESRETTSELFLWLRDVSNRLLSYGGLGSCFEIAHYCDQASDFWKWKSELLETGAEVVRRAANKDLRPDVSFGDLLGLVNSIVQTVSHSADGPSKAQHWLSIVFDGLKVPRR